MVARARMAGDAVVGLDADADADAAGGRDAASAADDEHALLARGGSSMPALSENAKLRVASALYSHREHKLIRLETITPAEIHWVDRFMNAAVLFNILFLSVVTALARSHWAGCTPDLAECSDRTLFLSTELLNFVLACIVSLAALLLFLYYVYELLKKVRYPRAEAWWVAGLLLPAEIVSNNPLFNLDRVSFLTAPAFHTPRASNVFSALRYAAVAFTTFAFTYYFTLRFGALIRKENVDQPYPPSFYLIRVVPSLVTAVIVAVLGPVARVELSAQLLVSPISLARAHLNPSSATIAAGLTACVLGLAVLLSFFVVSAIVQRTIGRLAYRQARLKNLNHYFFVYHTVAPVLVTMSVTALCSALFPASLTDITSLNPATVGSLREMSVLDVPFLARAGTKVVYTLYVAIEAAANLPAQYRATWIEEQILRRIHKRRDRYEPQEHPFLFANELSASGRKLSHPDQLVLSEVVELFNQAWMVYLDDDTIKSLMSEYTSVSPYNPHLKSVWRERSRNLTAMVTQSSDTVFVAFRGTQSTSNWSVNFDVAICDHEPLQDPAWLAGTWKTPGLELVRLWNLKDTKPKVHRGFATAYESLRVKLLEDIHEAVNNCSVAKPRVILTGHSLGGALASLCAFDLRVTKGYSDSQVSVISFGSPKIGNRAFASRFSSCVPHCFRIVNQFDVITLEPRVLVHHFQHAPRAVVFTADGSAIFDPLYVDLKLIRRNNFAAHSMNEYRARIQKFIDAVAPGEEHKAQFFDFAKYDTQQIAIGKMRETAVRHDGYYSPRRRSNTPIGEVKLSSFRGDSFCDQEQV